MGMSASEGMEQGEGLSGRSCGGGCGVWSREKDGGWRWIRLAGCQGEVVEVVIWRSMDQAIKEKL